MIELLSLPLFHQPSAPYCDELFRFLPSKSPKARHAKLATRLYGFSFALHHPTNTPSAQNKFGGTPTISILFATPCQPHYNEERDG